MGPHSRFLRFDCVRRTGPRRDRACRRARGRQGRCAPLKRWPEDGPSLTAAVRDGTDCAQHGRMVPIEQKDGTSAAVETVDFPLPLPACWRACGKRTRLLAVSAVDDDDAAVWRRSGGGGTIAVVGFDEEASGGHGGQP